MSKRDQAKRLVRAALSQVRRRLTEPEPDPPEDLEASEVVLDAFQAVHKHGIGWEFTFVDLRDRETRQSTGTVAGALLLSEDELIERAAELDVDTSWILLHDRIEESTRVAMRLRARGYHDVWGLGGGFAAWRLEGGPVQDAA